MPDDDDMTPKLGRLAAPPRRIQSQTERDMQGVAAKLERERASSQTFEEDYTDRYEGEELRAAREQREPLPRIRHLEDRVDALQSAQSSVRVEVANQIGSLRVQVATELGGIRSDMARDRGEVIGAIGALAGEVSGLAKAVETVTKREDVAFELRAGVHAAQAKAETEVTAKQALDEIDKKRSRRRWFTQLLKWGPPAIAALGAAYAAGKC